MSVGLIAGSASADSSPVTQISFRGLPRGWQAETDNCRTGAQIATSIAHVKGPGTPPNGAGSLRISESNSDTIVAVNAPGTNPLLSSVHALNSGVYSPKSGGLIPTISLAVTVPNPTTHYLLVAPSTASGSWVNLNAATQTMGWVIIGSTGPQEDGVGTLQDFVNQYPQAVLNGFLIAPDNECGNGSFYVDGVHYTVGSTNVKVNFETPLVTTLTDVLHPTSTRAGHLTPISARLKRGATELAGQSVQLWVRPKGATSYRLLRTMKTNRTGLVSTSVAPGKTTTYQWRYVGVGSYASSRSAAFTIVTH